MSELNIAQALERQYRASMEMLSQAVTKCPEELWLSERSKNRFWHLAYHSLFFTHLYLHPSVEEFKPWARHREDYQFLGVKPWPPHDKPVIDIAYSKDEILEYRDLLLAELAQRVGSLDLAAPSGFPWLSFSRLEAHLYNIRHLQHHTGQMIERLRTTNDIAIGWVGIKRD